MWGTSIGDRGRAAREAYRRHRIAQSEKFLREAADWEIILCFCLCTAAGLLVWWWMTEMGF